MKYSTSKWFCQLPWDTLHLGGRNLVRHEKFHHLLPVHGGNRATVSFVDLQALLNPSLETRPEKRQRRALL